MFNKERHKLNDAIKQFENQISNLSEDLERYKSKENASEKYIFFKKQQIEILKSTLESFNEYSDVTNEIILANQKQIAKIKSKNFRLEGICLLHGISDFISYLRMSEFQFIATIKDAYSNKWRNTPFELLHADTPKQIEINKTDAPIVPYADLINKAQQK